MMWLMTIPAIAIPKVAVMWQSEPLICALVEHHSCSTSCWSPGASYTAVSVPLSPLMSLAFGHRHPPVPHALFTPWFCIGFSSLYTHWNFSSWEGFVLLEFLSQCSCQRVSIHLPEFRFSYHEWVGAQGSSHRRYKGDFLR